MLVVLIAKTTTTHPPRANVNKFTWIRKNQSEAVPHDLSVNPKEKLAPHLHERTWDLVAPPGKVIPKDSSTTQITADTTGARMRSPCRSACGSLPTVVSCLTLVSHGA